MPSPFDDPSTSTDLDDEEEELQPLEEAPSAVSSELDPSVTNPVSCVTKPVSCRPESLAGVI